MMKLQYRLAAHQIQSLEHAYAAGFYSGALWTGSGVPGGPYYCRGGKHAMDREDRLVHDEWHRGLLCRHSEVLLRGGRLLQGSEVLLWFDEQEGVTTPHAVR